MNSAAGSIFDPCRKGNYSVCGHCKMFSLTDHYFGENNYLHVRLRFWICRTDKHVIKRDLDILKSPIVNVVDQCVLGKKSSNEIRELLRNCSSGIGKSYCKLCMITPNLWNLCPCVLTLKQQGNFEMNRVPVRISRSAPRSALHWSNVERSGIQIALLMCPKTSLSFVVKKVTVNMTITLNLGVETLE